MSLRVDPTLNNYFVFQQFQISIPISTARFEEPIFLDQVPQFYFKTSWFKFLVNAHHL